MKQTAYLLDPETTIFRAVELPAGISFKPIYDLIGCRLIELVRFDERHSLFVDEEGFRDGLTASPSLKDTRSRWPANSFSSAVTERTLPLSPDQP